MTDKQLLSHQEEEHSPGESTGTSAHEHKDETLHLQLEDLTLAELVAQFLRAPRITWRLTKQALAQTSQAIEPARQITFEDSQRPIAEAAITSLREGWRARLISAQVLQLSLFLFAVVCAVIGTNALLGVEGVGRTEDNALAAGAPYLWLSFCIWLGAELVGSFGQLRSWWQLLDRLARLHWLARIIPVGICLRALQAIVDSMSAPPETSLTYVESAAWHFAAGLVCWYVLAALDRYIRTRRPIWSKSKMEKTDVADEAGNLFWLAERPPNWKQVLRRRLLLALLLTVSSIILWLNTANNRIEPRYILLWITNSLLWAAVFAPANWNLFEWLATKIDATRRINWRAQRGTIILFAIIMVFGINFRLLHLDSAPREMTSDHVEKIQDAYRVYTGEYKIFFPNNGGREPVQMYLMSALASVPGLGFNFFTLKLLAVIESILTLPVLFWMGIELAGEKRTKFNISLALILAALVAVSYWHVIISRQGLRIPLTPLVTALLLIYLARAMRRNCRSDYVKAALLLGFGLYMYQAVRILPVVIVVGVGVALFIRRVTWRQRVLYLVHLGILVFVALMIFLPMLHFWLDYPNAFWMRTSTRILGDHLGYATPEQAEVALQTNVSVLMHNLKHALLMFNWKGDIGWFNGAGSYPVLDIFSGAFLVLGAAAWLARMIRSRDPVIWLVPFIILIMLLPTILSIAHPDANPSNSRALGAAPAVYLLAALPIAMIARGICRIFPRRLGLGLALLFCSGVLLLANQQNSETYFERYASGYLAASFPHSEAGQIVGGFAESDGAIGNAYSVGFPYWWDYRALGIEAGYPMWPNDGAPIDAMPQKLASALQRTDEIRLDPDRDLLFLHNVGDAHTTELLREWFPDGRQIIVQSYQPEDRFVLYRVPALGDEGWAQFIGKSDLASG